MQLPKGFFSNIVLHFSLTLFPTGEGVVLVCETLSEAEFAECVSSYDKLIENEEGKQKLTKNKNFFLKVVGGTDTRKHEAQSNIQLTKHNRNAATQNNLPSQATLGFHLPRLPRVSTDSWEAGKPRKAVQFQFQSKTLIIPQNGCKFSIYKSMWLLVPLELKAPNVQGKTSCHQQGSWGLRGMRDKPQASRLLSQTSRLKDRYITFWVSLRNLDAWHSKCFTCSQLQLLRMFLVANKNSWKPRLYSYNVSFLFLLLIFFYF